MSNDGERRASEREELLEIYKIAVEEYRFQARFNWNRTQYLFALDAAILAVGANLIAPGEDARPGLLIAAVFVVGALVAVHAIIVTANQHDYYRSARDHMQEVGRDLGLESRPMLLQTTPGMRGGRVGLRGKLGRVTLVALRPLRHLGGGACGRRDRRKLITRSLSRSSFCPAFPGSATIAVRPAFCRKSAQLTAGRRCPTTEHDALIKADLNDLAQ